MSDAEIAVSVGKRDSNAITSVGWYIFTFFFTATRRENLIVRLAEIQFIRHI